MGVVGVSGAVRWAVLADITTTDVGKTPPRPPQLLEVVGGSFTRVNGVYELTATSPSSPGGRPVWEMRDDELMKIQWSTMASIWMIDQVGGCAPYCVHGRDDSSVPLDATWECYQYHDAYSDSDGVPTVREYKEALVTQPQVGDICDVNGDGQPIMVMGTAVPPQPPQLLEVVGGSFTRVNGVYELTATEEGGRPVWEKRDDELMKIQWS